MAQTLKSIEKQKQVNNWIWESIIRHNTVNVFVGQQSRGKSMLVSELIKSTLKKQRGQEYLGYGVHQCKTLYISTEMDENKIKERFADLGVDGRMRSANTNLFIYYNPMPTLGDIKNEIEACNPDLVIVDVLVGLVNAEKIDINSYSEINALVAQLKKFGKAFILVHHMNRNNQSLGSTAITSAMDTRMEMLETSVDVGEDGNPTINQTIHVYGKGVSNRYINVVFKYPHFELAEADNDVDELDKPLSKLMAYVIDEGHIEGSYQQIAQESQILEKYQFNPKKLGYLLKLNADVLQSNNISYETKRKTNGFHLLMWYNPGSIVEDTEATEEAVPTIETTPEDDDYES